MGNGPIVVIGAANLDIHFVATSGDMRTATSNPSRVTLSAGGVGRNIAESLARWGASPIFVSAVGDDPLSRSLVEATASAGVDTSRIAVVQGATCGLYAALLHAGGELATAASAMDVTDAIDRDTVRTVAGTIASAAMLVLDANIPERTMQAAVEIANSNGVPVVAEPVSVEKARRLARLRGTVLAVTPNSDECDAFLAPNTSGALDASLVAEHVVVTMGAAGVRIEGPTGRRVLPATVVEPVDVTGAGDALVAGLAYGVVSGATFEQAVRFGMEVARRTVGSVGCVDTSIDARSAVALLESIVNMRSDYE